MKPIRPKTDCVYKFEILREKKQANFKNFKQQKYNWLLIMKMQISIFDSLGNGTIV